MLFKKPSHNIKPHVISFVLSFTIVINVTYKAPITYVKSLTCITRYIITIV